MSHAVSCHPKHAADSLTEAIACPTSRSLYNAQVSTRYLGTRGFCTVLSNHLFVYCFHLISETHKPLIQKGRQVCRQHACGRHVCRTLVCSIGAVRARVSKASLAVLECLTKLQRAQRHQKHLPTTRPRPEYYASRALQENSTRLRPSYRYHSPETAERPGVTTQHPHSYALTAD